jgi:hypothetical protein
MIKYCWGNSLFCMNGGTLDIQETSEFKIFLFRAWNHRNISLSYSRSLWLQWNCQVHNFCWYKDEPSTLLLLLLLLIIHPIIKYPFRLIIYSYWSNAYRLEWITSGVWGLSSSNCHRIFREIPCFEFGPKFINKLRFCVKFDRNLHCTVIYMYICLFIYANDCNNRESLFSVRYGLRPKRQLTM